MAPTLRPAQTASAREAMRAFFCDLCQKGYTRMNEYEAHLSSYDHSHKQRLKDMKAMVRDPTVTARARRQEAKAADAVISIKLGADGAGSGSGTADGDAAENNSNDGNNNNNNDGAAAGQKRGVFRKGGFRSAFVAVDGASSTAAAADAAVPTTTASLPASSTTLVAANDGRRVPGQADVLDESDTDNEGYEMYDPHKPTD
ncbi:c2h2 finger domain containing protein [Niveomyces insectorum RCEF 264]|uniref:C2h2 finger domain containing protein n=1 Tax=Niveomyces insectorum RCEF 264 TaxID=1081102 RepID=A0A167TEJ4_9HYPO|nr:c2h2 finger domain containing protein [Niveomyces insectorum RCEF 264]